MCVCVCARDVSVVFGTTDCVHHHTLALVVVVVVSHTPQSNQVRPGLSSPPCCVRGWGGRFCGRRRRVFHMCCRGRRCPPQQRPTCSLSLSWSQVRDLAVVVFDIGEPVLGWCAWSGGHTAARTHSWEGQRALGMYWCANLFIHRYLY